MNKSQVLRAFKAENRVFLAQFIETWPRREKESYTNWYRPVKILRSQVKQINGTFRRQLRLATTNEADSTVNKFKEEQKKLFKRYQWYTEIMMKTVHGQIY